MIEIYNGKYLSGTAIEGGYEQVMSIGMSYNCKKEGTMATQ
jgi:hypothetical protein